MTSKNLTKKDLMGIFWRSMPMEASFNYERMMSLAFSYSMSGVIQKLYSDVNDQKALAAYQQTLYMFRQNLLGKVL